MSYFKKCLNQFIERPSIYKAQLVKNSSQIHWKPSKNYMLKYSTFPE